MKNMKRMFDPGAIAVIGASEKAGSLGRIIMDNLLACRKRTIFPVNPKRKTILEFPSYPAVADIPEHVDLGIIITAAPTVAGIVEECGRTGMYGVIIISDGFRGWAGRPSALRGDHSNTQEI